MKFDVSKLKEMNDLDFEQVANWPFEVKAVVALVEAVIIGILCYFLIVKDKLPMLDAEQLKEPELKSTYQAKYGIAVNLKAYEEQLARIQQDFSSMLKSLPTSDETPGLLDDITYVGTSAGLTFELIAWQPEVAKEFYTELPIQMEVQGDYHEFGDFVSSVARLPRIVTMHDFEIEQLDEGLNLRVQAKTYRTGGTGEQQNEAN